MCLFFIEPQEELVITNGKAIRDFFSSGIQLMINDWIKQNMITKNECHIVTVYIKIVRCCSVMLYKIQSGKINSDHQ